MSLLFPSTDLAPPFDDHLAPPPPRPPSRDVTADTVTNQLILSWLGQRYIQYHPVLAEVSSVKAALLLGHALYWTRHWLIQHPDRDGWFWKTAQEWQTATGLSTDEQQSARRILVRERFIEEVRRGVPARLWYRVDLNQLCLRLATITGGTIVPISESTTPFPWIQQLLGRPILFFKPLVDVTGKVSAGLYLSHLLAAQRLAIARGHLYQGDAFYCPVEQSMSLLKVGHKFLRNARQQLRALALLHETWTPGIQPKQLLRIDLAQLQQHLFNNTQVANKYQQGIDSKRMAQSAIQGAPFSGNWNGENVQSRDAFFPKQGEPKAGNKNQEKGRSNKEVLNTYKRSFSKQQQPPHQTQTLSVDDDVRCSGFSERTEYNNSPSSLVLPDKLSETERQAALSLLQRIPAENQQVLLDEWAGQLARKTIANRLGYLRSLVIAQEAGEFIPTVAVQMSEARAQQARIQTQRATLENRIQNELTQNTGRSQAGMHEAFAQIRSMPGFRKTDYAG